MVSAHQRLVILAPFLGMVFFVSFHVLNYSIKFLSDFQELTFDSLLDLFRISILQINLFLIACDSLFFQPFFLLPYNFFFVKLYEIVLSRGSMMMVFLCQRQAKVFKTIKQIPQIRTSKSSSGEKTASMYHSCSYIRECVILLFQRKMTVYKNRCYFFGPLKGI